ncbi:MAG: flagellar basal-body rod protein FlgF [Candidatus Brocadiaceae bacterium]|uniref:flagellar basal-body rod protein FlgF n=1 Tax=Candidatus Wunengus sp. YC61 TaxID=3367698 RepID=UPI0027242721|nr:flagellar basal-body rod protein FlgF [Candidatus Brocadiaceae bacterium]
MIAGLYTGASSMVSQSDYQAVIARNLANINTVGYKKNVAVFQSFLSGTNDQGQNNTAKGTGSSLGAIATDFSQGMLEYTGNDMDISIKGEGFFTVKANDGSVLYTRKGEFMLSRDMKIVTPEGWSLLSTGGEIQLPQKAKNVTIKGNGSIAADGKEIGNIRIVKVSKLNTLESVGGCAYRLSDNAPQPEDSTDFEVANRYLEKSNVNAVDEMVNMIANMRGFQVGHKVTDSINETLKKLIQLAS